MPDPQLPPGVIIRTFRFPEDYAAVFDLWSRAGPGVHLGRSDAPEEIAKKLQRDPELFLVAEADGRIVGAVMGGFDGRRGLIYHLAVDPAYRRRGIGTALMAELERRLVALGCLRAYLLVVEDNHEVVDFYRRLGWEPMPVVTMGKTLVSEAHPAPGRGAEEGRA